MQGQPVLRKLQIVGDLPGKDLYYACSSLHYPKTYLLPGYSVLGDGLTHIHNKIQLWPSCTLSQTKVLC